MKSHIRRALYGTFALLVGGVGLAFCDVRLMSNSHLDAADEVACEADGGEWTINGIPGEPGVSWFCLAPSTQAGRRCVSSCMSTACRPDPAVPLRTGFQFGRCPRFDLHPECGEVIRHGQRVPQDCPLF